MFRDVIDICRQGRCGFSVWIFRDVIAFSRHGVTDFLYRFSVTLLPSIVTDVLLDETVASIQVRYLRVVSFL